ncbi:MAG: ATP-dependent DNA helicase PcrA, partial [Bacillales bacterium]
MEENVFPHSRSLDDEEEMQEERRLAYVGITRAEEKLYLTSAAMRKLYGNVSYNQVSRFVEEIPEELLDFESQVVDYSPAFTRSENTFENDVPDRFSSLSKRQPIAKKKRAEKMTTGAENVAWKVGDRVQHKKWGIGTIVSVKGSGDEMELNVAFPAPTGIKKLLAKFAPITKAT